MLPYIKFRLQRVLRRWRRDLRQWRSWLTVYFQRNIWGKWRQLGIIRRLVVLWWGFIVVAAIGIVVQGGQLNSYYLVRHPLPGGTFAEGEVGSITNINPVLPEPGPAADVSRLVFSGLTRINPQRQIEGDLATSWSVSSDGLTYTFKLRHGVKWHDGVPFTAHDVAFTIEAIQNPDSRSPLADSWQGVTVTAVDDYTVTMKLPSPFTPFIYSTTVGILPAHLLESTDPQQLRVSDFNQHPVGTGPFELQSFVPSAGEVELTANPSYYAGRPKLDSFIFRLYPDQQKLTEAYAKKQVTAISGLTNDNAVSGFRDLNEYQLSLADEVAAFFRTSAAPLNDKALRQALAEATNRQQLISRALGGNATAETLPLLPGSLGYSVAAEPPAFNLAAAESALTADGWQRDKAGNLTKDGQQLKLRLVTGNTPELEAAAAELQKQWSAIGVQLDITAAGLTDLQQSYIRPRNYDILLYGINLGADPDVYAFWHSSQASDPGLNLSQWSNSSADKALESARIVNDPAERAAKYHTFLASWVADEPAVVLYNPDYLYAASKDVAGIKARLMVDPSDRFYGVEDWTVRHKLAPIE